MVRFHIRVILAGLILLFTACKKKESAEEVYTADFSHTGGIGASPLVVFTAKVPDGSTVNWDFGDSTSGSGISVSHNYNGYACYAVKMRATRNDQSYEITKSTAVSPYSKVYFTGVMIETVPPFGPGGQSWDPGDDPDLKVTITVPGSNTFSPGMTLANSISGLITFPGVLTTSYDQSVIIDILDDDPGGTTRMSTLKFKLCDYIGTPLGQSLTVESGGARIKAIVSWVQ